MKVGFSAWDVSGTSPRLFALSGRLSARAVLRLLGYALSPPDARIRFAVGS